MGTKYNPRVITNGLQVYLDAGNSRSYPGSGSIWYDLKGNRNFTLNNSPVYISTSAGGSIGFTAASSHYANATSLQTLSNWTVEVWHYYTAAPVGTYPVIVGQVYPGINNSINFSLGTTTTSSFGTTDMRIGYFTSGAWQQTSSGYAMTPNRWHHVIGTCDSSNLKIYINGSLQITTAHNNTAVSSTGDILLMKRWDASDFWGGHLSTVKIYDRALSAQEVLQNYNATKKRYGL